MNGCANLGTTTFGHVRTSASVLYANCVCDTFEWTDYETRIIFGDESDTATDADPSESDELKNTIFQ